MPSSENWRALSRIRELGHNVFASYVPAAYREQIKLLRDKQIDFAPNLEKRIYKHMKYKSKVRARGEENWSFITGQYTKAFFTTQEEGHEVISGVELRGTEIYLFNLINAFCKKREEEKDTSPVVALDFGGMHGLSFARLATAMKELVEEKKVLFVVSNLAFVSPTPNSIERLAGSMCFKDRKMLYKNYKKIFYGVSDAEELTLGKVVFPDRGSYALRGKIDILHERDALIHGQINDLDLPLLGGMLSRDGVLLLGSHDSLEKSPNESYADFEIRKEAHGRGKENLEKYGLKKINGKNNANYAVYSSVDFAESFF